MNRATAARLVLLALLWGSSFLWIAVALRGLSPVQIAFARLALGAAVLTAIVYARGLRLPRGRMLWAHLTVAAFVANALPYWLFAVAQQHVESGVAGVINATTPLWTLVLAFATGHDRAISGQRLAGLLIGFAGTVLIFSPWQAGSDIASWGGTACLIASVSYAVGYVYMDRYLAKRGIEPLTLSASQLLAAAALVLLAVPFDGLQRPELTLDVLGAILVLGAFGTGIAYVLNYWLITHEGTAASVVIYLLPIVAIALGALVLRERITLQVVVGMIVVLLGVALTRRASREHNSKITRGDLGSDAAERLTGWLADQNRFRRAFRLDKETGTIVARGDGFDGDVSGLIRRSFGHPLAVYKAEESGLGAVVVVQQGRQRLVLDSPAQTYQATVGGRVLRRVVIHRDGRRVFSATGFYPWLALGPLVDLTWDGLDEMGEDYPRTIAEIVAQPQNRQNVMDRWASPGATRGTAE